MLRRLIASANDRRVEKAEVNATTDRVQWWPQSSKSPMTRAAIKVMVNPTTAPIQTRTGNDRLRCGHSPKRSAGNGVVVIPVVVVGQG
jgi:hypothetical protein